MILELEPPPTVAPYAVPVNAETVNVALLAVPVIVSAVVNVPLI